MMTVAELLVETLADIGVRQIFGVVGDALNPLSEAIRKQDRIEWIGVHHEEGAALAAAAQAKLTGRLGVCCGTTGPGANHLVAGLYEAKKDHAPVLAISGGVPAEFRGVDYRQENAPNLLFRDVAAYTETITDPVMAAKVVHEAIAEAYGARGVAHINIPQDVIGGKVSAPTPSVPTLRPRPEVAPSPGDVEEALRLIGDAKTVAVLCGTGCRGSEAELIALSDRLRAPLMHTYRGQDMLPYDDPHWIGGVGLIGGQPGVDAVKKADLLLMLGSDYPYSEWLPQDGNLIQVDERATVLGRRATTKLGIVGSVKPTLRMLLERLPARTDQDFFDSVSADRAKWNRMLDAKSDPARSADKIHPQAIARAVSDRASDDAIFVTDTGLATLWAANWTRPSGRQRFTGSFNNQSVGTGMGLANGAQALDRARQVILHIGDGGFLMMLGEFMTAVGHQLPVKVVVYDNNSWGLVHLEMEQIANPISPGANFRNPDFAALAKACGAEGFTVRQPDQIGAAVDAFLAAPGPAILHAHVAADELPVLPHIDWGMAAKYGLAKFKELFAAEPAAT